MLIILQAILGCLSYAVAALILVVDTILHWCVHVPLKTMADSFLKDGDNLTGWEIGGEKANG